MSQPNSNKEREAYLAGAAEMYDELRQWREDHPEASIDEIAGQVRPRRRELLGELQKQLARQDGKPEIPVMAGSTTAGDPRHPSTLSARRASFR